MNFLTCYACSYYSFVDRATKIDVIIHRFFPDKIVTIIYICKGPVIKDANFLAYFSLPPCPFMATFNSPSLSWLHEYFENLSLTYLSISYSFANMHYFDHMVFQMLSCLTEF